MPFLAYLTALLIAAAGLALGVDFMTRPPTQPTTQLARTAPDPVRQIPIGRADIGDPHNKLSPLYPAAPGSNLPGAEAATTQKADVKPTSTVTTVTTGTGGSAIAATPRDDGVARDNGVKQDTGVPQTGVQNATAAAAPSCNVQACASAYKSFRASDCSYQPFDGPRKFCEGAPAQGEQIASQPQRRPSPAERADDRLDDVVRAVRRLPDPVMADDDDDPGSIAVIERPNGSRNGWQRRWVIEGR